MKELEYFNICNLYVHIKGDGVIEVEDVLMYLLFKDEELLRYYILDYLPNLIVRCVKNDLL